ncbi:MAG: sterol desaturase family protein [Gammaproteobacteria bacterium]
MTWNDWLLTNEVYVRLGFFFGVLAAVAAWEIASPRRTPSSSKLLRWSNNLGLVVLNSIVVRLLLPAAAVTLAALAMQNGWGLLNIYSLPPVPTIVLSIVALDMIIYLQHVMFHAVPILWRLHRVHHADPEYDVTTGTRFHPLEIIISMLIKLTTILVLGPPVVAVVLFEIILNATAMFNHGNIRLPDAVDRILRLIVVTPDMHRVHHSVEYDEANSNFGFSLPWWDRLFGTYRAQPLAGHQRMVIGIHGYHDPRQITLLPGMLLMPFKGKPDDYAINRHRETQTQSRGNDQ